MLNKPLLIVRYLHLELIFLLLLMVQLLDIPLFLLSFQHLLQIQESLKLQIMVSMDEVLKLAGGDGSGRIQR